MVFRAVTLVVLLVLCATDVRAQRGLRPNRTSGSIAGRIIHSDGAAAEGARVAVYAVRDGAPAAVAGTAVSAHDGRYEVLGLPAGEFVVGVTPQRIRGFGGDSRRLTTKPIETLYPGTTDRMKAQRIMVFDGIPTEGIDIWLEPEARRYSISGRVFWPDGLSPENVIIEYGGPDVPQGLWYVNDPGGLFTVEGASRGRYVLLARGETRKGPLIGIVSTDVANDSVHDVRLILRQPGSIEGRVVVEGRAGADVPGLRLTATHAMLKLSPLYPVEESALDAANRFTLSNLLGEYTLSANGLPSGWRVRRITRGGAALSGNRISVLPGERVTDIEVIVGNGP